MVDLGVPPGAFDVVVTGINAAGGRAVGVSGKDGNMVLARKAEKTKIDPVTKARVSVDLGFVGEPERVDAEVLRRFGSTPIRSTATLAGNIANGSPIGDSMPCLLALGANLVLRRGDKTRSVLLENFYTGMKQNVLQAGEFIEVIELPKPVAGQTFRAHKVSKWVMMP